MTILLWTALGIAFGAAMLQATLGMRRPLERAHLAFACMMAFLALTFYFALDFYRAPTAGAAVEAVRRSMFGILGGQACILLFVPAYTRVRIPRLVMAAFWVGLAIAFLTNIWAPSGLWYSGEPELVRSTFLGEPYHTVVAPPMSLQQHAYAFLFISFLGVTFACAVKMFRRGERQRSVTFCAAMLIVLVNSVVDVIRDTVGGSWPYMAMFGFVAWALIMSVQLAYDFRAEAQALGKVITQVETQAERLRSILESMRALEQNMHVPIEMLEAGVAALSAATSKEDENLHRLRRAVTRLREFGRAMPDIGAGVPPDLVDIS